MVTCIEVANQAEADAVQRAFAHEQTRAFILIVGTLLQLPTDRARQRVLNFVADKLDEDAHAHMDR